MIFQQIDFHNVAEIIPHEDGWQLIRIPEAVRAACDAGLQRSATFNTGVELRFRLLGEHADIHLRTLPMAEGQMAYLYFGSIQGGWQQSSYTITKDRTVIRINRPDNMAQLQRITAEHGLPFSPEVCRLVLPYGINLFLGLEGDVAPPRPEDLPRAAYLAYGSSITHGSLALAMPCSYPFRIAQGLGCDYRNLGCAGTAMCEEAMARWLVSRDDWHFATLEMGINMMGMEDADFERRIDAFTGILADDGRPVFATSIFRTAADGDKHERFRAIVRKYAAERLHFVEGPELLERADYISQDGVHPTLEGILQIADRWQQIIRRELPPGIIA